ncbi:MULTISPECIES: PAS domain S-box protein [Trichocoleus]|uniref:histidine kinase n=1 Tax=Trichocoleus desertorum GB2-A4 TaxID=2933944 RepID=A0ABV0JDD0_9CYAN|nr:PAS domain S-box protein [Trichocoleus sp. FACHB-46]MBD1864409.1 PAS domain S-box protein [Trichocoleus sp. FACHB-46]
MTSNQQPRWYQFLAKSAASDELPPPNLGDKYQVFSTSSHLTRGEGQPYRSFYQQSSSIQLNLDATGTIATVNLLGAACLGYSVQELIGNSVFTLFHPDDRDFLRIKLNEYLQNVISLQAGAKTEMTQCQYWELRQVCKDGRVIWVKAFVQPDAFMQPSLEPTTNLNDSCPSNSPVTTVRLLCEDITEWKQAEAGLQQERNFVAAVLDTVVNLIVVLDPQGRIVRFNRACEQMTGYTFAEVKGIPFWDVLLLPEEIAGVKAAFSQLRSGLFPNEYENYWITKAGSARLIAWSNTAIVGKEGKVEYVVGTGLDITERRQTELALQRSQQQQYQHLVDSVEGIVWEGEAESLQFSFVSPKAERILGYPLAEWLSDSQFWLHHIHPDDRAWVMATCQRETQARRNHTMEYRMIAQDGRVIWFRDMITVVPDAQPMKLRGVMLDITERRQAEIALQMSEARYRAVVEQAAEGIFLVDVETKRLLETNAACQSLLGYSAEELSTLTLYDVVAHDRADIERNIQHILAQKRYFIGERQYRRKDGSLIEVEVSAHVVSNHYWSFLCVVVHDVTAYKQAGAALEQSLALLRATLESTADGIMAIGADCQVLCANRKLVEMWGISDELMAASRGEERLQFLAAQMKDPNVFLKKIQALQTQPEAEVNDLIEFQDGRVVERYSKPQRLGNQIVGRVWSFRDITQRQQAEAALAQSEAKWRSLIQNSSDIIAILEADGTVRYQSPAVERIMGHSPQELVGRNALELIHPEDVEHVAQAFQDLVAGILPSLSIEFRFQHKDETWRFIQSTGTNLLADPSVLGIVTNSRDITERKRAERALQKQTERERLMRFIAQRIHQSLDLAEILDTTVAEVRQFLQTDRAIIFRFNPDGSGCVSVESVTEGCQPILGRVIHDRCFTPPSGPAPYPRIRAIADLDAAEVDPCYVQMLAALQVKASLVVPIMQGDQLWGLLIAHHCIAPRQWLPQEVNFLEELATQVAIAIQQSELYQQVQRLNSALESQVMERTAQLQQALNFEAMLKRITDKVRDSLDESQILQTAVQELALVLQVACCDTALYDANYTTSTICYEYTTSLPASWGRVLKMTDFPELYSQLLQGQHFQFCEIVPNPCRDRVSMLACPILDDQGAIGDLWLFRDREAAFSELEIRLVQQVTNQCAIAIRQARLYQEAQAQVRELEKLNRLKDDFLSTVSHELRTPVCNIKMAIQMLELSLNRENCLNSASGKTARYLQVLQDECNREISLVNDLLDLQRLEVGSQPLTLEIVQLQEWIQGAAQPFYDRARGREQRLRLELPTRLPPILSHSSSLTRILAELLNNACKYTPPGEEIVVSAHPASGRIQLKVTNFGVEIPAAELPHIFEKFYRVPSTDPWKQGGTGLGLALVQKLTEYLGGSIEVESAARQTCFTVELPLTPNDISSR